MGTPYRNYAAKLSIPGKSNDELTYTFFESSLEHQHTPLTLFGVFSIKSTAEQYQLLIAETVKNFLDYYRKISESSSGTFKQGGVDSREFIFENAIQYTHEHVTHALSEAQDEHGRIQGIDIKKIHFVLGVICEGQLHASITGNGIHAIYFYPVYQKHGFSHYANVDVINGNKESGDYSGSSRLFSSIISGSISIQRSVLAVCNDSFLDYISAEQLKQAVTGNPIEAVTPYFQKLLGKIHAKNDFCALFLDARYTPSAVARAHQQTVSNESMAVLNSKEEGTEKILFPAFTAQIKKILPILWKGFIFCIRTTTATFKIWIPLIYKKGGAFCINIVKKMKTARVRHTRSSSQSSESPDMPDVRRSVPNFLLFGSKIRNSMKSFFSRSTGKVIHFFRHIRQILITKFTFLPHTSKSLLFVSITFLVLFGVSIIIIQKKNTERKQQNAYNEMLRNAEEKNDLAEASLIYDNTEKARALLTEAQQVLREYPVNTVQNQERHKKILDHMQAITDRINHVTPLKNLTALAQFDAHLVSADRLKLISSDDHVLTYTMSEAYAIDLTNGIITPIQTQIKIPSIGCGNGFTKTIFYLCDAEANRIFMIDSVSTSIQATPIRLAKNETSLDALAFYNKRLYILSAGQGSIFRHAKNKDGFDIGTLVIKNLAIDPQMFSFAIDGNIYVLERDGQIAKYGSGKKELFILPFMDSSPTRIEKLWTDTDISSLYIFEPSQKRILVVDKKTRALKDQLTSDMLASAKEFTILPKKKLLLFSNGTTIYQSPIEIK